MKSIAALSVSNIAFARFVWHNGVRQETQYEHFGRNPTDRDTCRK